MKIIPKRIHSSFNILGNIENTFKGGLENHK